MITKHRTVMHTGATVAELPPEGEALQGLAIRFSNHASGDDGTVIDSELVLSAGVWVAMGAPATITVGVEAGDHLNHVKSGDRYEGKRAEQRRRLAEGPSF